jgi:parvulin-like peptidyl-prolyl isomerase
VLVALTVLALGACDDENAGGTGRADTSAGGKVLAVAEGQDITQGQVDNLSAFYTAMQGGSIEDMSDADKQALNNQMIIFAADNVLIKNAVLKSDKSAADNAAASIEQQYEMFMQQYTDLATQISSGAIAQSAVMEYVEAQYYYTAFGEQVKKEQPASEGAIQQLYEEYKDEFVTPASMSLRHILIMSPDGASSNGSDDGRTLEAARTSIEAIYQRVQAGEDFAELAKQYSEDPGSAENGGLYENVTKGQMVPAFDEAAFKLKKGEVSEIVESEEYGFFIIKAESDVTPEQQIPLDTVRSEIESFLAQEKVTAAIDKLKEDNPIKYNVEVDPETGEPPTTVTDPAEATTGGATTDDAAAQ